MGSLVSWFQRFCERIHPMKASIAMIGLYGSGKTTILYRMKLNETVITTPTIAFNVETLDTVSDLSLVVTDISVGQLTGPVFIQHYLTSYQAFVFVVDSKDTARFEEAKEMLFNVLEQIKTQDLPFIVLANKQDLVGACSPSEIVRCLDLEKSLVRKWEVCGCCGTTGEGLHEAFEILCTMIKDYKLKRGD